MVFILQDRSVLVSYARGWHTKSSHGIRSNTSRKTYSSITIFHPPPAEEFVLLFVQHQSEDRLKVAKVQNVCWLSSTCIETVARRTRQQIVGEQTQGITLHDLCLTILPVAEEAAHDSTGRSGHGMVLVETMSCLHTGTSSFRLYCTVMGST